MLIFRKPVPNCATLNKSPLNYRIVQGKYLNLSCSPHCMLKTREKIALEISEFSFVLHLKPLVKAM